MGDEAGRALHPLEVTALRAGASQRAGSRASTMRFFRENGLSIAFVVLYAGSALGHAVTGVYAANAERAQHGMKALSMQQFLHTGAFLDSVAVNWQAAVLQLYVLIVFTSFLYQKGAVHSRKLEKHAPVKDDGGFFRRNSLSLAFLCLFVFSFMGHVVFGARAESERNALTGGSAVKLMPFVRSPSFWTSTLSCWEAEFFALVAYVLFSIPLRQHDSPESKPVDDADEVTGESNH